MKPQKDNIKNASASKPKSLAWDIEPKGLSLGAVGEFYLKNIDHSNPAMFMKAKLSNINKCTDIVKTYCLAYYQYAINLLEVFNIADSNMLNQLIRRPTLPDDYATRDVFIFNDPLPAYYDEMCEIMHIANIVRDPIPGYNDDMFEKMRMANISTNDPDIYERLRLIWHTILLRYRPNILLLGETGTGKDIIAKRIHNMYCHIYKKKIPLEIVNCASIPETLIESELFGHEKGAFTNASFRRVGCFERANNGVLFLDELEKLSLHGQGCILRSLEDKYIYRLGGKEKIDITNVTYIFGGKPIIKDNIRNETFLRDLYYRVSEYPMIVKALRQRPKDDFYLLISELRSNLLENHSLTLHDVFSPCVIEEMANTEKYQWRGNVRQLKNVVSRMILEAAASGKYIDPRLATIVINDSEIDEGDPAQLSLDDEIGEVIKKNVQKALYVTNGNRTKAARFLGITSQTLYNYNNKYKIF